MKAIAEIHPHQIYFILLANLPQKVMKRFHKEYLHTVKTNPLEFLEESYWESTKKAIGRDIGSNGEDRVGAALALLQVSCALGFTEEMKKVGFTAEISIDFLVNLTYEIYHSEQDAFSKTPFSTLYVDGKRTFPHPIAVWAESQGHKVVYLDAQRGDFIKEKVFRRDGYSHNQIKDKIKRENFWAGKIASSYENNSVLLAGKAHFGPSSHLMKRLDEKGINIEVILDSQTVAGRLYSELVERLTN